MDQETFKRWLDAYGRAWEARDPAAAAALFAPDARYHWTPFGEPKRGRAGIAQAWQEATSRQYHIRFRYEILAVKGSQGIAHWWTSLVRAATNQPVRIDGILLVTFNSENLCEMFREWWHAEEPAQEDGSPAPHGTD